VLVDGLGGGVTRQISVPFVVSDKATLRSFRTGTSGHSGNVRVALLLIAVIVLLVGLPLASVAWSRARHVRRPPVQSWLDVLHAEARRHKLNAKQVEQVTQAVNRGSLVPLELRSVTVQAAAAKVAWLESALRAQGSSRRKTFVAVLMVVAGSAVVATTITHRAAVSVVVLVEVLFAVVALRVIWGSQLRRARQAVKLNTAPNHSDDLSVPSKM
jgi:hypothetical protein